MIVVGIALSLFLAQAEEPPPPPPPSSIGTTPQADAPPPPPSPPPLLSAPDGPPAPPPGALPGRLPDSPPGTLRNEPPPEGAEEAPGTPTAWWKRSLVSFGISAGVGGILSTGVALAFWQTVCSGGFCGGQDLFGIFAIATLTAMFTIPAAVSIVGRAMGGRAKYGYALIGSALFGAAGLIVALALTGGSDVPIVVIPVFATLMVLGSVASFELFSWLKERAVKAEPVVGLLPGGASFGLRATF